MSDFTAFLEPLITKAIGEKMPIVQMGVLVCRVMDKLLGRAPGAPAPLTAPGPQFSWSPAPHSPAFPSHSLLSQPKP